jgi:hypothetical protein
MVMAMPCISPEDPWAIADDYVAAAIRFTRDSGLSRG